MKLEKFKNQLEILTKEEGDDLREKYIERFVNRSHSLYMERIEERHKFKDGYCYIGYLWDFMKEPILIKESYVNAKARDLGEVYVFWDINTCERIFIKDYWKFDKDAVLKLKFADLLEGQEHLPEDIYVFDDSFSWTLILTHEDIDGERHCLKSGDI